MSRAIPESEGSWIVPRASILLRPFIPRMVLVRRIALLALATYAWVRRRDRTSASSLGSTFHPYEGMISSTKAISNSSRTTLLPAREIYEPSDDRCDRVNWCSSAEIAFLSNRRTVRTEHVPIDEVGTGRQVDESEDLWDRKRWSVPLPS